MGGGGTPLRDTLYMGCEYVWSIIVVGDILEWIMGYMR